MVPIPQQWVDYLAQQPESGMGYQVVNIKLADGRRFNQVVASNGYFTQVRGYDEVPFTANDEVTWVKVTHKRWKFRAE
jgi:hypothetical protein